MGGFAIEVRDKTSGWKGIEVEKESNKKEEFQQTSGNFFQKDL